MENQFRNDGEMPPELAAQFPVFDYGNQKHDDQKSKSKQTKKHDPEEMGIEFFVIYGGVNFGALLIIASAHQKSLVGALLFGGVGVLINIVALHYMLKGPKGESKQDLEGQDANGGLEDEPIPQ